MAPDLITSSVLGGDPAQWPAGKPSKLIQSLKAAPLGRMERIRRFGVDCGDGLTWAAGWQPGGEYTKQLIVKNVSKQVVRIKYKLPESKFFSMAFPETIQLMPGLTTVLQVRDARRRKLLPPPLLLVCCRSAAAPACCARLAVPRGAAAALLLLLSAIVAAAILPLRLAAEAGRRCTRRAPSLAVHRPPPARTRRLAC